LELELLIKKQMRKHNGFILTEVSGMNSFSNGGRLIQDRVGRDRVEFDKFLNSYEFKIVSDELLKGYEAKESAEKGSILLKKLLKVKNESGELLHEKIVDYLSSLKYGELKYIEKVTSNLLVVLSHVGIPDVFYDRAKRLTEDDKYYKRRFSKNSFFNFFKTMDMIVGSWPMIEKNLPARLNGNDFNLIEFLKPVNNFLIFYKENLLKEMSPSKNKFYVFLNETYF